MYTVVEILCNSIPNKIRDYEELIENVEKAQLGGLSPLNHRVGGGFSPPSPPVPPPMVDSFNVMKPSD